MQRADGSALSRRQLVLRLPAAALAISALPLPGRAAGGVITDPGGFRYFDIKPGDGAAPKWGQLLRINYAGYTVTPGGTLKCFDSTYDRKEPYLLKHGNGQTIKGLELALHTMAVGGKRRVVVPQETLGFIFGALGPLPPLRSAREALQDEINFTEAGGRAIDLVYDIELLATLDDVNDRGFYNDVTVSVAQQEAGLSLDAIIKDAAARNGEP
jgi:hypothetical protein